MQDISLSQHPTPVINEKLWLKADHGTMMGGGHCRFLAFQEVHPDNLMTPGCTKHGGTECISGICEQGMHRWYFSAVQTADGCYNEEKEEAQQQFGLWKISSSVCRVFRRRGDNSWLDPCLAMHAISCHIVQLKVIASSQLSLAKHSCISFFTNSNEIKSHLEWKA